MVLWNLIQQISFIYQSNFESGFGYQYGADDTIEIYMNEKWFVFEYREESE